MKDIVVSILKGSLPLSKEEISSLLEQPKDQQYGDYAFPCFALAKILKKNPVEIAKELQQKIKITKDIEKIELAGPYVNFFVNREFLAESTLANIKKQGKNYGARKNDDSVVLEFPSPNTNKPLHIGHARNIIFGQAITQLLRFFGNKVTVVNLNNDRGVHICKSMIAYEKFGKGDSPKKSKKKTDHFVGDYYVKFSQEAKTNPELETEALACLQKWESGDKKTITLWKKMNGWALKGFAETYKKFNLKIDQQFYESDIYDEGKKIVLDALKRGIVNKEADGAVSIDLSKDDLGKKTLLRSNGTSIYITQDLYLAVLKHNKYKFDRSLIVSATEQLHHFKTLFKILERFGYSWAKKQQHLSYGMVNLESGRMKSREGNVVDSDDLISEMTAMAHEEITKRYSDLSELEKKKRATIIAMAAIRYYFLKVDPKQLVVFKPEEAVRFDGDTGPYLLYTYARARSILRKKKIKSKKSNSKNISDVEKRLIKYLSTFPLVVSKAHDTSSPNLIANFAFELGQTFNEFYHQEQVIGSDNEQFRLELVDAVSQVLKQSLNLLNIEVLEKM